MLNARLYKLLPIVRIVGSTRKAGHFTPTVSADVKRLPSARQAVAMFPGILLAWNYRQKRGPRLNSRPDKRPRRLLA
eukprot:79435-Heterocapsa_arctica.AAC.1